MNIEEWGLRNGEDTDPCVDRFIPLEEAGYTRARHGLWRAPAGWLVENPRVLEKRTDGVTIRIHLGTIVMDCEDRWPMFGRIVAT